MSNRKDALHASLICTQCPKGCRISVDMDNGKIITVTGNSCPKGDVYAREEIVSPKRFFTSTVATKGLNIPMIPVKTDKPIPKGKMFDAVILAKRIVIDKFLRMGDVVYKDFIENGTNLIVTKDIE